jgi:hypothetical protein
MSQLVKAASGAWVYEQPEPLAVPELSDRDRRELIKDGVDKIAGVLVERHGLSKERANEIASRNRDRFDVLAGPVGVVVTVRDPHEAKYNTSNPTHLAIVASGFLSAAERADAERERLENPPAPPTEAEVRQRIRREQAMEPRHSGL